jgi:L-ascorbate metabolism protein UlaG (beta-lactamase superfamily)
MVKVKWFGHSAFQIKAGEWTILIDPFFTGNPATNVKPDELNPQFILVTHGHGDHLGDAIPIAKRSGATIIGPNELAVYCEKCGAKVRNMHIGGAAEFPFGKVKLTQAIHGSAKIDEKGNVVYLGIPCGFIVEIEGKRIYHAGDTALFGDMKLIGERHPLDLALLPIGDNFTMGPEDAAYALTLLKPKIAVPMHYGTWPIISGSPEKFAELGAESGAKIIIMKPGEEIEI